MSGQHYRDLIAWQKAMDLVEWVCEVTWNWPPEELSGRTSQVRRAAVSIPSNIAEGQGRVSPKESAHHLSIAHGSLREVETQILIAHRLKYVDQSAVQRLRQQASEVGRLIQGLPGNLR